LDEIAAPAEQHPMTQPHAAITTILFADLVGSTELLQQVGDEQGQRIFQQHHKLLSEVVATTAGQELRRKMTSC
jgi:class 3 adenylate cyclase